MGPFHPSSLYEARRGFFGKGLVGVFFAQQFGKHISATGKRMPRGRERNEEHIFEHQPPTWRIIPVSKWLLTIVSVRPLRIGCSTSSNRFMA